MKIFRKTKGKDHQHRATRLIGKMKQAIFDENYWMALVVVALNFQLRQM